VTTRPRRDARAFDVELLVALGGQVVVLLALTLTVGVGSAGWLACCAFTAIVGFLLAIGEPARRAAAAGSANRVTLLRATLVGGVTALVADMIADDVAGAPDRPVRTTVMLVVASVALALDLADGYVARRTDTASELGARFDMELDSLLVLVLSVLASRTLGLWVLAIGLARYLFVAAMAVWPQLTGELPFSRARKVVAATQGVVMIGVAAPFVPRPIAAVAAAVALVTLVWSFGRDTAWLLRRGGD
jgi:phosphatidylglycerophosphate synthase